jgi:hypothetical protein
MSPSTAALIAAAALVAGCSETSDCDRYAAHVAEVSTRGLTGADLQSRRATVMTSASQACGKGRVSAESRACVLAASTIEAMLACELGEQPEPKTSKLDAPPAKPDAAPLAATGWPRAEAVLPSGEVSRGSVVVAGDGYRFQVPAGFEPTDHPASDLAAAGEAKGFVANATLVIYATVEPFAGDLEALVERERAAARKASFQISKDVSGSLFVAGAIKGGRRLVVKSPELVHFRMLATHEGKAYTLHIETPNVANAWANVGTDVIIRGSTFHIAPPAH